MKTALLTIVAPAIQAYRAAFQAAMADMQALKAALAKSQQLHIDRTSIREKVVAEPALAEDAKYKKQFVETMAEDEISKAAIEGLTAKSDASMAEAQSLRHPPVVALYQDLDIVIRANVDRRIQEIGDLIATWGPGDRRGSHAVQADPVAIQYTCRRCAAARQHKEEIVNFSNQAMLGNAAVLTAALDFLVRESEELWGATGEAPTDPSTPTPGPVAESEEEPAAMDAPTAAVPVAAAA